jgi:hypothetical protein
VIWADREEKYFYKRDWTGQITLKPLQKIALSRTSTVSQSGAHLRDPIPLPTYRPKDGLSLDQIAQSFQELLLHPQQPGGVHRSYPFS